MVDVQVGGVLGHTYTQRDTHLWSTGTHTLTHIHLYMMKSRDRRWWMSRLVEYWDTHTDTETLTGAIDWR